MPARILIVDDEPNIVATLAPLLRSRGYDVVTAMRGKGALELVERDNPDVIVLVGAMAIRAFLGPRKLDDVVGRRFEWHGRAVIPFPHSSGVSRWGNRTENKAKVAAAVALLRAERERLGL